MNADHLASVSLILTAILVVVPQPVTAQSGCNGFDDFEDDAATANPTGCFYTFSEVGTTFVTPSRARSGVHSMFGSLGGDFTFTAPTEMCTDATSPSLGVGSRTMSFYFQVTSLASAIQFGSTASSNSIHMEIQTTGVPRLRFADGASVTTSSALTTAIVVDTWYGATLRLDCEFWTSNDDAYLSVWPASNPAAIESTQVLNKNFNAGTNTDVFSVVNSGTAADVYFDDFSWTGTGLEPSLNSASSTAAVTSLVGFDVDPSGATAVARTNGGDYVRVYPGGTLSTPSSVQTGCNRSGGVATMASYVAYFDCDGTGSVDWFRIRSPSLGTPTKPPFCNEAGFCLHNIPATDCGLSCVEQIEGNQDTEIHIAIVEEFPIDYSRFDTKWTGDRVFMAMAFADTTGSVGVWTYTHKNNVPDKSERTSIGISGQTPDQICVHRDPNGKSYLYGASETSNVRGFEISFRIETGYKSHNDRLIPIMSEVFPGTSATAGPRGVACGDGKVAIANPHRITVYVRNDLGRSSTPLFTPINTPGEVPPAGIAMSHDGRFIKYVEGSTWHLIYANNGTELTKGSVPSGTFRAVKLHGYGCVSWIATATNIARYNLATYTCPGGEVPFLRILNPNDVDGDGIANKDDPDIDGDGLCNEGLPDQPLGTPGAINGCKAGDLDDDGDGDPNSSDPTPGGSGGGVSKSQRSQNRRTMMTIILGFVIIGGAALIGWAISGGVRFQTSRFGETRYRFSGGSPMIIGLFAGLGLMGSWFVHTFFVIVTIVLGVFALVPIVSNVVGKFRGNNRSD